MSLLSKTAYAAHATSVILTEEESHPDRLRDAIVGDDTKGGAAYGLEIILKINTKNFFYNFKYKF